MTPSHGFLLLLSGILGIYCEFLWPGRMLPGVLGCALAATAAYFLWQNSPTRVALALLGVAVLLFLIEIFWTVDFLAGITATLLLACGFSLLFPAPRAIPLVLVVPVSLAFGSTTLLLAHTAKIGRASCRERV